MESTLTVTKWVLDPAHSELMFKVKHMMISNVKGEFKTFSAEVEGEEFTQSKILVTIDAASIYTNDEQRDTHLKSADFFDVEKYKELSFEDTSFQKVESE